MSRIRDSGTLARWVLRVPCTRKTRWLVMTKRSRYSSAARYSAWPPSPRPSSRTIQKSGPVKEKAPTVSGTATAKRNQANALAAQCLRISSTTYSCWTLSRYCSMSGSSQAASTAPFLGGEGGEEGDDRADRPAERVEDIAHRGRRALGLVHQVEQAEADDQDEQEPLEPSHHVGLVHPSRLPSRAP